MRKMELRDPVARATVLIYEAESLLGSYAASAPDREDSVTASEAAGQLEDIRLSLENDFGLFLGSGIVG